MITEQDIENRINEIERSWQDEKIANQSYIDFKDYSQFDTLLRKKLEEKGIKAKLTYSFMGLEIDYIRD